MLKLQKLRILIVFRQVFATFASCLLSISVGITFGYSGVLLPQLKNDPDFPYDEDLDSWIASIPPLAMTVGCIFAGAMSDAIGRKSGQLVITPLFIIGWLIMGFAKNNIFMLLGRFITGLCTGAVRPCSMVYIGEITAPKYRSITLSCPALAVQSGILIGHKVGGLFPWRTSCFIFGVPNILCIIILTFLTESPLWLIGKGRMEEGLKSFELFRGKDEAAQKELASVLEKNKEPSNETSVRDLLSVILSRTFMKALATIFFLFSASQFTGLNIITFYTLSLFETLFGNIIDPHTLTLIIDVLRVVVAFVVCIFANVVSRRISFLVCTFITTVLLILLSIYFFLKAEGFSTLCLSIFIFYVMLASAIMNLSWPFLAEIFPNNLRGVGSGLGSAIYSILLFISVVMTPGILKTFGVATIYALFSVVTLINFLVLCFLIPETNGKSLQEIENSLYGSKKDNNVLNQETVITKL